MIRSLSLCLLGFTVLGLGACDWMPGAPKKSDVWQPPAANLNFADLYRVNCLACHSDGSNVAASIPMNFPAYLDLVSEERLRQVIEEGIKGTTMPAFGISHGGPLTEEQVDVLVKGIFAWNKAKPSASDLPPYSGSLGDVARGAGVFGVFCAHCHGADGNGGDNGGSVVDPVYLSLVSDQYLRTITIVGRPDLGMPGFRDYVPGKTMSDQDISDVVAWMISHRLPTPSIDPASVTPPLHESPPGEPIYE